MNRYRTAEEELAAELAATEDELSALRAKHINAMATDELIVAGLRGDNEQLRARCIDAEAGVELATQEVERLKAEATSAVKPLLRKQIADLEAELEALRDGPFRQGVHEGYAVYRQTEGAELSTQLHELREVVDDVLSDIECAELKCWCFTRAAMRDRPACSCANCAVWRELSYVLANLRGCHQAPRTGGGP